MSPVLYRGWSEVRRRRRQIEGLVRRARSCDDLEIQSDLSKLLVVQISGFVENALQELCMEFCRRNASGPVLTFAGSQLAWSRNPTDEAIETLLRQFSPDWADAWSGNLTPEGKAALNSIVGLRNAIAHGDNPSVSLGRTIGYLQHIDELVEWCIDTVDPAPSN